MDGDVALGRVLRQMRVEANYTLAEAAASLDISQRVMTDIEDGDAPIYFTDLLAAVRLYGGTVNAFLLRVVALIERTDRARGLPGPRPTRR